MEELTLEEAIALFVEIITQDLVHQDYYRTVDKARLYKQLCTGEDISELFHQYAPREDDRLFNYKVQSTQIITPAIISSLMNPYYKVPRTDRLVKKVTTIKDGEETDDTAADTVLEKMRYFYGSENNVNGLDFFMQQRYIQLGATDPNAWIVTEFDTLPDGSVQPYPFEIPSKKARNFGMTNNVLKWLVGREDCSYMEPITFTPAEIKSRTQAGMEIPTHIEKYGFKWSMYIKDHTIVFEEVASDSFVPGEEDEDYDPTKKLMSLGGLTYIVSFFNHLTGIVPAKRVGHKPDIATDGRTFVSFYDDALCFLLDSIQTVAEFTITKKDHVFPQKIQYVPPCPGESELNGCFKGRAGLGGPCKICKGSGKSPVHTSGQDVITITLPDDSADMVDLNKIMAYFSPPIELVKFQNELVKQVKVDCHQTVFNSTVLLKDSTGQAVVDPTATGRNFDMDSINDTLAPFAESFSSFWLFEGEIIARQTDNFEKVDLIHRFPADFKMKTIGDLYAEMKTANDSEAPTFLIEMLNDDIAATKFQDDPDLLLQYDVKKRLNPFRGKTETEIQNALNTDYTPLWKKVFSVNFEDILTQAELEKEDFYLLSYGDQVEIVKEITDKMIEEINATKVTPTLKPVAVVTEGEAIYSVGDTVTIIEGNEQDPTHAGVSFKVDTVTPSGDSFSYKLSNEDGSITVTYNEDDLN